MAQVRKDVAQNVFMPMFVFLPPLFRIHSILVTRRKKTEILCALCASLRSLRPFLSRSGDWEGDKGRRMFEY